MISEPLLQLEEIQGHILLGFASWHMRIAGFQITNVMEAAVFINKYVDRITDSRIAFEKKLERKRSLIVQGEKNIDEEILLALSFSKAGLQKFGLSMDGLADHAFINGMKLSAGVLNDLKGSKSDPENWKFGGSEENTPDIILIAGSDNEEQLKHFIEQIHRDVQNVGTHIFTEKGIRLPGDKEHFGFKDAISQPAVRGRISENKYFATRYIASTDPRSELFAKPGQPLVWPGQFVFGYPIQLDDPKTPGPRATTQPEWTKNGSFLVIRRLNQDFKLFKDSFSELSTVIRERYNENIPPATLEAKFVGRWPDGTPLIASPDYPDGQISNNFLRENNFSFQNDTEAIQVHQPSSEELIPRVTGDPIEQKCPFFAHIRKVNPRDDATEEGREKTLSKQILRRGINFGVQYDEDPSSERGLLFMSYQSSIKEQFEFLQRNWANSQVKPNPLGNDFIIGQSGRKNNRRVALLKINNKDIEIDLSAEWVFTTGGGYFFTPAISTIRKMASTFIDF